MNINLYPHNQETYEKIIEAWKTNNRVATVQATGTGKTFLILKCIFTYPNMKTIVLAPTQTILDQLSEKADNKLQSTQLMTYTQLSFKTEEEIRALDIDMIVLDEFHRCGAEKWGSGVQLLLSTFPESKLLGLTATPIRHLDNGRDMSDELFEGNVVTNLSLPQAIVRGILPMPKYISALYTFDEEVSNLQNKINKSSNDETEKIELNKIVNKLKHKLQKSNGIPTILKKHLKNESDGKFIVFFKDGEHLYEMKEVVEHWFKTTKLGKKVETYIVLSKEDGHEEELESFKENKNNDCIRLLLSVNKLNEGLHVDDITGVILLRPTTSPIIYFQQIGRALQAGNKKQPYVFDLVNNFSSLGSNKFKEELVEAIKEENDKRKQSEREKLHIDQFEIYDEVHEISDVFAEIEDRLTDNWDVMFELYRSGEYDKNDKKMKNWVVRQRVMYKERSIATDRIKKLNNCNFIWDYYEENWDENYKNLQEYVKKYGNADVPSRHNKEWKNLGRWVTRQKLLWENGEISDDRILRLNELGLVLVKKRRSWREHYDILCEYKNENGNCDVPLRCSFQGIKLGHWVSKQRKKYKDNQLEDTYIDMLNRINFIWDAHDYSWSENYDLLIKFKSEFGHCNVPKISYKGIKLGAWVSNQRSRKMKNALDQEKIRKLDIIGFVWNGEINSNSWNCHFELLVQFKNQYKHTNVPVNFEMNSLNLGSWVKRQRNEFKNGKLSKERADKLNGISFNWQIREKSELDVESKAS